MRGIGCYSKLSKNSKNGGRKRTAGVLWSDIRLCSGGGITGALGVAKESRSQACLWPVPLAWHNTKVSRNNEIPSSHSSSEKEKTVPLRWRFALSALLLPLINYEPCWQGAHKSHKAHRGKCFPWLLETRGCSFIISNVITLSLWFLGFPREANVTQSSSSLTLFPHSPSR